MVDYNLTDIQTLIGQMVYEAFQKNLMEFTQLGGSVYSDIGMYPQEYINNLGGDPTTGIPSQRRYEFDQTALATKAQNDIMNKYQQDVLNENKRVTDLGDKLTRDVEAGRITQQIADREVQREQIASQNRIAEMENAVNEKLAAIREMEVKGTLELGKGRLDLDKMLGLRSADKEDFLANLERAGMEAEMAANPRDFIKLAFVRANKTMPDALTGLSGNPTLPGPLGGNTNTQGNTQTISQTPSGQAGRWGRTKKGELIPLGAEKGNVSVGPTFSTVGEKGFEYALLAPGSVIAPVSKKGEKSSMRNAISAIYNQLAKSGVDPNTHKEFQTAQKGLSTAVDGVVLPSGVTMDMVNKAIGDARTSNDILLQMQASRNLRMWFPQFYTAGSGWGDPSRFDYDALISYLGTTNEPPPPPDEPPDGTPGNPYLPRELGDIPFIQQLRAHSAPTPYLGTENRYDPNDNMTPINPYNAQVYFDLRQANPTDVAMANSYESSFGIPEDDFMYTAAQTAQGFGLTPNNGRAVLRPMFN